MPTTRMPVTVTLAMIPFPAREARRLEIAARIMLQRGWCQRQPVDNRGRVDCIEAYRLADRKDPEGGYGLLAVAIVVDTNLTMADWQDANGRSRSEVVAAFQTAARELMKVAEGNG